MRSKINGYVIGSMACIWFSILFMIKLRCSVTDEHVCGFMSFTGGFSWHLFVGLLVFLGSWSLASFMLNHAQAKGWSVWMDQLGRSMTPLLGLVIAVIWEILPSEVIHPSFDRGSCPDLPIICHDIPLMGLGGLFYWTAPFILWAAVNMWMDIKQALYQELTST